MGLRKKKTAEEAKPTVETDYLLGRLNGVTERLESLVVKLEDQITDLEEKVHDDGAA